MPQRGLIKLADLTEATPTKGGKKEAGKLGGQDE